MPRRREDLEPPPASRPLDDLAVGDVAVGARARRLGDDRLERREAPLERAAAGDVVGVAVRVEHEREREAERGDRCEIAIDLLEIHGRFKGDRGMIRGDRGEIAIDLLEHGLDEDGLTLHLTPHPSPLTLTLTLTLTPTPTPTLTLTRDPNPKPKGLLEDGVDEDGLAARGVAEQVRVRGRGTARRRRAVEELLEDTWPGLG